MGKSEESLTVFQHSKVFPHSILFPTRSSAGSHIKFSWFRYFFSLTHDCNYQKFESQNYGTLWHFRSAIVSPYFIMVAMVRWRSQRVTDRSHVYQMLKCHVGRVFDREMAVPKLYTISRAHDFATALNLYRSSTMSLKCSKNFVVDVEHRLTVWCWRVFFLTNFGFFLEKREPRKGKIEKLKIWFSRFAEIFLSKNC